MCKCMYVYIVYFLSNFNHVCITLMISFYWIGKDVIAMDDSGNTKKHDEPSMVLCGGFLFLNSTATTKALWQDLVEVHKIQMGLVPRQLKYNHIIPPKQSILNSNTNVNWGNEQSSFTALVKLSKTISLAWLPYEEFQSGAWLKQGVFNLKSLKMIHSNWIMGLQGKVDALRKSKLWFVGRDTCHRI
jgi:hypothetical protein